MTSGMITIRFAPTSRVGFINNVDIATNMMQILMTLDLIKISRMTMGDNKLYIYLG